MQWKRKGIHLERMAKKCTICDECVCVCVSACIVHKQETHRQIATKNGLVVVLVWVLRIVICFVCMLSAIKVQILTHVQCTCALYILGHTNTNARYTFLPCLELQTTMISQTHWRRCAHNYVTRASIGETLAFVQHSRNDEIHWNETTKSKKYGRKGMEENNSSSSSKQI